MQPFGRNRYGLKIGGLCPFGERELGPHLTQCGQAEAYLHAKFRLDPSNRLATVHECHRQDRTDRQRTDSIGRTVLQTVAQKMIPTPQKSRGTLPLLLPCNTLRQTFVTTAHTYRYVRSTMMWPNNRIVCRNVGCLIKIQHQTGVT